MRCLYKSFIFVVSFFVTYNLLGQVFSSEVQTTISHEKYCKILDKHVKVLKKFNDLNKKKKIIKFGSPEGFEIFLSKIVFESKIAKICVKNIVDKASLDPLFKTWDFVKDMDMSEENFLFFKEFSILIISLYENLLSILTKEKAFDVSKSTLREIIGLYNVVYQMPIRELIMTLEKCFVLFTGVMQDYGIYSQLTWGQWFRRYWWVPPTVAMALLGAAFLKRVNFRPAYFGRPHLVNVSDGLGFLS